MFSRHGSSCSNGAAVWFHVLIVVTASNPGVHGSNSSVLFVAPASDSFAAPEATGVGQEQEEYLLAAQQLGLITYSS